MKEQYIRRESRRTSFAIVDKKLLENKNLSWKAKAVLCYILSKPDNWQVRITDLVNQSTDGRDSTLSALKELKKNGYLVLEKIINEKHRIIGTRYMAYEQPLENPLAGGRVYRQMDDGSEQLMEESTDLKAKSGKVQKESEANAKPQTENPFVESNQHNPGDTPHSFGLFPQTGFPDTELPDTENPTYNKNELNNIECTKNDSFIPSLNQSEENQRTSEGTNPGDEKSDFPEIDFRYLVTSDHGNETQVEEIQRIIRRLWGKKRYRFKDETLTKKEIRAMLSCLTWRHIAWVQERFDEACRDREIKNISGYLSSLIFDSCLCTETTWNMPLPDEGIHGLCHNPPSDET